MWGEIVKQIEMLEKKVEARGSGFDVVHCHGEDKGKSLGHHDTKEEAMAQHRAIEASKHAKKSIDAYLEKNGAKPASQTPTSKLPPRSMGHSGNGHESPGVSRIPGTPIGKPVPVAMMIKDYVEKQEAPKAPRKPPIDRPQADLPASEAFSEYTKPGSGFGKDVDKQLPTNVPIEAKKKDFRPKPDAPESSGSNLPHPTAKMINDYLDKVQFPHAYNPTQGEKYPAEGHQGGHSHWPNKTEAKKPIEATAKPQTPPKPRGGDTRTRAEKYQVMPKWGREILD